MQANRCSNVHANRQGKVHLRLLVILLLQYLLIERQKAAEADQTLQEEAVNTATSKLKTRLYSTHLEYSRVFLYHGFFI
jgi:hypothetical protein